ncbi:MFS transporter [Blastocystis sp. subtype 4]|uniref:MFS transporter n=1 Tax=Blastocystis sp. subtype 4 TaxID=944170 RepID=UPI00071206BE|nr:MFS transporter [Blastocystis sp. subtype 4]KNB45636.1 MFS transporter [Blastocystis sp. subtype 4]|eukprot:XP_014529078.1 MFS transporter [Blastocystis sp. subtype 4]
MNGSRQQWQRWNLYIVNFSHITSFYSILPMIPYLNMEIGIDGLLYAISFSGYYFTQLLSFLYFGAISDKIGRRNTLIISLGGLSICRHFFCFTASNHYVYILLRCLSGLFDCVISITQAYVADISSSKERATCLARLEAVMNAGQCIGPLIAGLISTKSVRYAIVGLMLRFFGVACDCFGFIYALFFLPESVESVVEKRQLLRTFTMVKQANRRGLDESLLSAADKEVDEIQTKFFASLRMERKRSETNESIEKEKIKNAHLTINYLIVIAIICEFCNKFIFSIFDTIVCQFGSVKHELTSLQMNLTTSLLSAVGSALNIFQTGFLFRWLINDRGISIPTVGSFAAIACIICIYSNRVWYFVGAILIIVGYGFYAPVAPSILSAESTEETHGKALSLANVGGQLAYIVSPLLLEELYNQQADLPFFITLIPAIILVVVMLMCSYLPGGKLAGQVSLADSLEHNAKVGIMTEDNEYETEFLGSTTVSGNGKNDKKRNLRVQRRQSMPEEPSSLPEDAEAFNLTASIRKQFGDDTMEI